MLINGVRSYMGYYSHNKKEKQSDFQGKIKPVKIYEKQRFEPIWKSNKQQRLIMSVTLNDIDQVEELLKSGVDPKTEDSKKRTGLHIAAAKGFTDCLELLLQYGADPNQKDGVGNTPLHLAACTSHVPTVTVLLKAGTDLESLDNQGYSPLYLATSKLKLLQKDSDSSSPQEIRDQVYQVSVEK